MRKIEEQMISAINDLIGKADYDGVYFKSGNTTVEQSHHGIAHTIGYQRIISVRLHGSEIAAIRPAEQTVWISDCGWQTRTTASRLHAIMIAFTHRPYFLSQIKYQWYKTYQGRDKEVWTGSDTLKLRVNNVAMAAWR
jgi:hypothetical protein